MNFCEICPDDLDIIEHNIRRGNIVQVPDTKKDEGNLTDLAINNRTPSIDSLLETL